MTNEFYCKLCDKTIIKKQKSKNNKIRTLKQNERNIIYKYHIEKPDLVDVVEILNKYINEFLNDFEYGNITCNFSLLLNNGLVKYKTSTMSVGQYLVFQR